MEPTIHIGSLVISKPSPNYHVNDIITFNSKDFTNTHRIVEVKDNLFVTKGDANDAPDSNLVASSQVMGKTIFTIPLIGYLISFAKTQIGFTLLIVIPATIIIYQEIQNIKKQIEKIRLKKKAKK